MQKTLQKLKKRLQNLTKRRKNTLARELFLRARARRQDRLFKRTGKQGHRRHAQKLRRQVVALRNRRLADRDTARKVRARIKKIRKRARAWNPAWGGSQGAAEWILQKASQKGSVPPISSRKRAANHYLSLSNPGSDHNERNTTAYAIDFATYDGAGFALRLADSIGWSNYRTGNYESYYWNAPDGNRYRVQILWGVEGHWNHVHLGVRRA